MEYLELTIKTDSHRMEELTVFLTASGFSDLVIEDQQEFESFLEENRAYWDYIDDSLQEKLQGLSQIKLYLPRDDTDGLERFKQVLQDFREKKACDSLELTVTPLAETNWEESWKENYPPQPVGETLVVLPYWLSDTDYDGRLPVILDPGLTFGTGAHPSTQMVMEFMEEQGLSGMDCLDLGSGSGILSITALRLGASTATGVDIDPKAEEIARQNALFNGYATPLFTALTGNVTADKKLMSRLSGQSYGLVLVNIVADVIIQLAPVLPQLMNEKTVLLLSGILDSRLADVCNALARYGLEILAQREKDEWRALKVRKRL